MQQSFRDANTTSSTTTTTTNVDHLPDPDAVTISRFEYENLLRAVSHFKKLKNSLLTGGLSPETLDVLIYGTDSTPAPQPFQNSYENHSVPQSANKHVNNRKHADPVVSLTTGKENGHRNYTNNGNHRNSGDCHYKGVGAGARHLDEDWGTDADTDADVDADTVAFHGHNEKDECDNSSKSGRSSSAVHATGQRTVLLRGLPDRVTHYDVAEAVRGGALLDVFLRTREHAASVSFVEESAAREFLNYVKQHDLYVAGKRVEALWSERQFYLPPYVRGKINNGATRNLMISNVNPSITEDLIRRDLEHIHNLIVISVDYKHGNVYVSTNSVHNALFARSCMMSRFAYKRMKISFYPDDCAEPFPTIPKGPKEDFSNARPKKTAPIPNRFQLLSIENSDDENYENDHDDFDGHSSTLDNGIRWADSEILA